MVGVGSLMEFQSSRFAGRTDSDGKPILLEDQKRTKWDRAQIQRGVAALQHAADALQRRGVGWGPYALQAAIAECHARERDVLVDRATRARGLGARHALSSGDA